MHPKGNQSWVFIGRTDVEAETPILWPPDAKSWLIGKDPDAGKDWGQEEKGTTEDKMVGWHHRLNGHGFGWTPGVGDGQGGLGCCGSWGCKESDMTEQLNWTEEIILYKWIYLWVSCLIGLCSGIIQRTFCQFSPRYSIWEAVISLGLANPMKLLQHIQCYMMFVAVKIGQR